LCEKSTRLPYTIDSLWFWGDSQPAWVSRFPGMAIPCGGRMSLRSGMPHPGHLTWKENYGSHSSIKSQLSTVQLGIATISALPRFLTLGLISRVFANIMFAMMAGSVTFALSSHSRENVPVSSMLEGALLAVSCCLSVATMKFTRLVSFKQSVRLSFPLKSTSLAWSS
jgi:hypothetical protein